MEYKLDSYIMSNLSQPIYQILTMPVDYQNSHLYNSPIGSFYPPNLNDITNVSMLNLNLETDFPMIDLNQIQNLKIYQPNDQCLSLQKNSILPSNQYIPNIPSTALPNLNISNPYLVNYGIDTITNQTNDIQSPNNMLTTPCIDPIQGNTMQNQGYLNQINVIPNLNNVQFQPIIPNLNITPNQNIVQNQFLHDPIQIPQVYIPNMLDQQPNQLSQGYQNQDQDQFLQHQIASLTKIVESLHQETSPPQNQYTLPSIEPFHQNLELSPQPHQEHQPHQEKHPQYQEV
jgi:hypothetical protein